MYEEEGGYLARSPTGVQSMVHMSPLDGRIALAPAVENAENRCDLASVPGGRPDASCGPRGRLQTLVDMVLRLLFIPKH